MRRRSSHIIDAFGSFGSKNIGPISCIGSCSLEHVACACICGDFSGFHPPVYAFGHSPTITSCLPYKHSTSGPPQGFHSPATLWRPAASQPQGGTEVGCKESLQRASSGSPPLSLILYLLVLPCASTLPPPEAQTRLLAWHHRVAIEGRPTLCYTPSLLPESLSRAAVCT